MPGSVPKTLGLERFSRISTSRLASIVTRAPVPIRSRSRLPSSQPMKKPGTATGVRMVVVVPSGLVRVVRVPPRLCHTAMFPA